MSAHVPLDGKVPAVQAVEPLYLIDRVVFAFGSATTFPLPTAIATYCVPGACVVIVVKPIPNDGEEYVILGSIL